MARYHAIIGSPLSADDTFRYLASFSNAELWDPGVLAARALDPGPARAGSRFRLTVPVLGLRTALVYEITRFSPPSELVLQARSALLSSTDRIEVTSEASGSTVSYLAEVVLRGPFRLFEPMLARAFPRVALRAVEGLATALADLNR